MVAGRGIVPESDVRLGVTVRGRDAGPALVGGGTGGEDPASDRVGGVGALRRARALRHSGASAAVARHRFRAVFLARGVSDRSGSAGNRGGPHRLPPVGSRAHHQGLVVGDAGGGRGWVHLRVDQPSVAELRRRPGLATKPVCLRDRCAAGGVAAAGPAQGGAIPRSVAPPRAADTAMAADPLDPRSGAAHRS